MGVGKCRRICLCTRSSRAYDPFTEDRAKHPRSFVSSICVPSQAARVVITWLNKAREAEEKRMRAAAEPLGPDNGGGDGSEGEAEDSEEDDSDHDEFVYDIQVR